VNEQWVTALAAAAELRSEHHLAKAILDYAKEQDIDPVEAREWALLPGLGAVAETEGGTVLVGNRRLLASRGVSLTPEQEESASRREAAGQTVAFVALRGVPVGLMGITDPLRPGVEGLVSGLKRAGVRKTVMLTGDNEHAARRVASLLGIDEVRAGLLPEEKVQAIRELQAAGRVVAMVGDGVNDAPALATADVSIAMGGSGTEVAVETADIALMTDNLERVPESIGLSRRILRVVRQNVVFAVAVVAFLLAGVVGRVVFLAGGMLIHEASVMLVILNGMRLLRG
jgi:Cd2+/Zn2+-exporting ATPase